MKIFAYFLPNVVLLSPLIRTLWQTEALKELIQFQQFAHFMKNIWITEEIDSVPRTMLLERNLNLLEHLTQPLFHLLTDGWWW